MYILGNVSIHVYSTLHCLNYTLKQCLNVIIAESWLKSVIHNNDSLIWKTRNSSELLYETLIYVCVTATVNNMLPRSSDVKRLWGGGEGETMAQMICNALANMQTVCYCPLAVNNESSFSDAPDSHYCNTLRPGFPLPNDKVLPALTLDQ